MKTNSVRFSAFRTGCLVLGLTLTILASGAFAQSPALKATIPFDFYAGAKLMPAGTYFVNTVANQAGIHISSIGEPGITLLTLPKLNRDPVRNLLVFHRYGETYFLSEIRWEGYENGHALFESKRELRLAQNGSVPESTVLRANR